ncbi:hypothetical protein [Micromonospora sp. NPDC000668]
MPADVEGYRDYVAAPNRRLGEGVAFPATVLTVAVVLSLAA